MKRNEEAATEFMAISAQYSTLRWIQFSNEENKLTENPIRSETFTFRCLIKYSLFSAHSECQWTLHWCISLYVNGKICSLEMFSFKINACVSYAVNPRTDAIYGIETIRMVSEIMTMLFAARCTDLISIILGFSDYFDLSRGQFFFVISFPSFSALFHSNLCLMLS